VLHIYTCVHEHSLRFTIYTIYILYPQAQNIKNFKSQRWQTLLGFNSQRRLLLTGTPLQNNLMELWSLMHFLMPAVFSSHTDFKEWFSNPLTGMVEGSQEYNDSIIRRLHQVGVFGGCVRWVCTCVCVCTCVRTYGCVRACIRVGMGGWGGGCVESCRRDMEYYGVHVQVLYV